MAVTTDKEISRLQADSIEGPARPRADLCLSCQVARIYHLANFSAARPICYDALRSTIARKLARAMEAVLRYLARKTRYC